jgi:hypothetical protein
VRFWWVLLVIGCGRVGFNARGDGGPGSGDGAAPDAPDVGYFVGPGGDDANPGTRHAPWRTLTAAIPRLVPGDRLTLLDGDYDAADVGSLNIDCSSANNGTAAAPIVVRADHPRRARLFDAGQLIDVNSCAYWELDDLFLDGKDDATNSLGDLAMFYYTDHIVVHGLLLRHANRFNNNFCVGVGHSTNALVEDVETYECFRGGFSDYDSTGSIYRRVYSNGRGIADVMNGYTSACPGGDYGLLSYYSRGATIVDAMFEGACYHGLGITAGRTATGDTGVGDNHTIQNLIALGPSDYGVLIVSDCDSAVPCTSPDRYCSNNRITNSVAIGTTEGFHAQGVNTVIDHVTALSTASAGVQLDVAVPASLTASATIDSVLVDTASIGFAATNQSNWSFTHDDAFQTTTPFSPNDGHVMSAITLDPALGGCSVYAPVGGPLATAGTGGTNVGADIRMLASTGAPAFTPQWAGCGAVVAGVNDDPTTSCIGVNQRLGCTQ